MTSLSVSLPQVTLLQPKISALATAVPCLKAFAPNARTRTTICSPDPVQATFSKAKPWATPDPDFWVTLTKTSAPNGELQVTSSVTSTRGPLGARCAGGSTWTSRNSPPEENATAGPDGANSANEAPARMATSAATASLARNLVLIGLLSWSGAERCAGTGARGRREDHTNQQRHGEQHRRQVPDEVEAAVHGEGCRRRDHPPPALDRRGGRAGAPQPPAQSDPQDRQQRQTHQAEFRRDLGVLVVGVAEEPGATICPPPSQVGLSGSGAGER